MDNLNFMKLHEKQMMVFRNKSRFKVCVCGRRFGKTYLSRAMLISYAAKKKKSLIWYIAPTFSMARDIMWQDLVDAIPSSWIVKKLENKMEVRLINGSVIQLKGSDKPDALRGRGVDFAVLDEYQDFKKDTWEKVVMPTLTDKGGHALVIGTPKVGSIIQDIFEQANSPEFAEQWGAWQFPTSSSPFIPLKEIEMMKANMDEKTFNMEFNATFETLGGGVYYNFNRNTHVKQLPPLDPSKPVYIGQDFNVDPMTTVIFQLELNPDYKKGIGNEKYDIHVKDEIYLPQSNVMEVCDEIERRYWRWIRQGLYGIYPDPAGRNRSQTRGESNFDVFRQRSMSKVYARAKHPTREDRYAAVNLMLKSASGRTRLFIDPKCKKLIYSLERTRYKEGTNDVDKSGGVENITDALGYPIELLFPTKKIKIIGSNI